MSIGTVIIVGGGGGGLATAALLCKNGYKVKIYEMESVIGGKAKSSEFNGFWIDEEFHSMVKVGENETFRDKVGAVVGYIPDYKYFSDSIPILLTPNNDRIRLSEILPTTPEYNRDTFKKLYGDYYNDDDINEIEKFAKFMIADVSERREAAKGKSVDDFKKKFPYISTKEYSEKNSDNKQVQLWFQRLGGLTYNLQPKTRTALSTYICLNHIYSLSNKFFRYTFPVHPKYGGLAALWEPYADIIRENGGEIYLECAVKKIVMEDGKAKGIILENGEFVAGDHVVCNIAAHDAFRKGVLNMDDFSGEFKNDIQEKITSVMEMTGKFNVLTPNFVLNLDKPMIDIDYCTFVDDHGDPLGTIQTSSTLAPRSAPPGKQKIQIHMYLDGGDKWSYAAAEKYTAEVYMPCFRRLCPDIDKHIESTVTYLSRPGTFGPMMNQMFGKPIFFPEKSPVDNFHFVGMFGGNVGMEGVLVSGARVAKEIAGKTLVEN